MANLVDPNDVKVPAFTELITNLPQDWASFADKNIYDPKGRQTFLTMWGVTGLLVVYDYELWKDSEDLFNHSKTSVDLHWAGTSIGDGFFQFGMAGAFAGIGWATDNNRLLRTSHQIIEAALATGAVIQLIKHFTGRESPIKTTTRTGKWIPFPEQSKYLVDVQKYDAVPSGHIATAWSTFMVIWENYPEKKWIPYVGFPVMFWVAEGLAGTGLHWWSDIPLGIYLGHKFSKIITRRNDPNYKDSSNYEILPGMTRDKTPTLNAVWRW